MTNILVGVGLGLLTSLLGWWIVARALTPNLAISPDVSKLPDVTGKAVWNYRIKVANVRRWWRPDWPALDLRISATLRIRGLREPTSWTFFVVPLGNIGQLDYMAKNHVFRVRIYDIDLEGSYSQLLPGKIREAIESAEIGLEELLGLADAAELTVVVSAAHAYTQARRAVIARYTKENVVCGSFARGSGRKSVTVVPDRDLCAESPSLTKQLLTLKRLVLNSPNLRLAFLAP